ncbi:MAG: LLM class flavin-dependent oxidoreductase [Chloroflexota bacterium]|jgi:FMN-dependent oxidoreductase (nitrilotriacetate monooxygenase family)|nr:LLM class flavin-dependent oxidoreductase [Chloroflexota bacterium]
MAKRMLMNAFSMNCVSHIQQGLWVRKDTRQLEYNQLDPWVELAQILEKGCFDALFLADVIGVYDSYRGGPETSIIEGMQTPVNDPAMLVPAMAYATENLGFAFTSSVLQSHPFAFARQMSTLDHLTRGRVAWNIVTSYLPNAGLNFGLDGLPSHDERYDLADEYLDVVYKLWEGSWEDDAVLRDTELGIYADPAKVHPINHVGKHFNVAGPHLSEPSPQRTPLLFQAGSSTRGRRFAAKHAECMFIVDSRRSLTGAASVISDVRSQAVRNGRRPEDIQFFQGLSPVVGGTEAEAKVKEAEYLEQFSTEGALAHLSGSIGIDLSDIDLDQPLKSIDTRSMRGMVKGLIESTPDQTQTFRDLIRTRNAGQFLTGSPEQIADALQDWQKAGVDGFNLIYSVTPGTFVDFIEAVVPILQKRGLMQKEYAPGPLREKMFGYGRLPARHLAAGFRRR